ncbi:MAG: YwaF family protein [Clostridia bacterium]|nr:YwaF family protein [Clostridia bacterium]
MRKFFYDHYTDADICGMYTLPHFLVMLGFFALLGLLLYLSRKLTEKQVSRVHFWVAVGLTAIEVVKISLRVYKKQPPNDWMPLFYCSLFLFAVWFALAKWEPLRRVGYSFMTMGGVAAAAFYTLYPSTGLGMYPLWHPAALHGIFYHFVMCYTGLLLLIKGRYVPKVKDALYYFLFVGAACIPSYFFNEWLGSNCMFLHNAFGLPLLDPILQASHAAYIAIVVFGQAVAMYWLNYGLYRLAIYIKNNKTRKNEKV